MRKRECPFCNQEVDIILEHIKKKHPKKLKFLQKQKPVTYKKLQKESKISQMIKSKDRNLFVLKTGSKKRYYKYQCIKCGKCCHEYDIRIQKEDIDKWEHLGKREFLQYIQINPRNIAMGDLELFQKFGDNEICNLDLSIFYKANTTNEELDEVYKTKVDKIFSIMENVSNWVFSNGKLSNQIQSKIGELKDFIVNNHDYLGEPPTVDRYGNPIDEPLVKDLNNFKLPHWFLGDRYSTRSILYPKSFKIIRNGWKLGLKYMLINELYGGCGFLDQKNNLCTIHDIKPKECREYPYDKRILKEKEHNRFLETCKGLKRIM